MLLAPILLLSSLSAISDGTKNGGSPPALKQLHGEWRAISVEEKGLVGYDKEEIAEVVIEIVGDKLIYKRNPAMIENFKISVHDDKKPAWIDLRLDSKEADPDKVCPGIFVIDNKQLKLCLPSEFTAKDPDSRPTEFKTGDKRPPQGRLLFVFERVGK
jgi:uncharacterized protein (TIGR03067 family)